MNEPTTEGESESIETRTRVPPDSDERDPAEGESEPIGTHTRVPSGDDERDAIVTQTRAP